MKTEAEISKKAFHFKLDNATLTSSITWTDYKEAFLEDLKITEVNNLSVK